MSTADAEAVIKNQFVVSQEELVKYPLMKQLTKRERLSIVSVCIAQRPNQLYSAIFITDRDELYGLGENGYDCNILALNGLHWRCDRVNRPVKIEELSNQRITTVCIGGLVATALDIYGRLHWWGLNHTWTVPPEMILPKIERYSVFSAISCGQAVVAGLGKDGKVWCFGNTFTELPTKKKAVAVSCGASHLAVCTDDGYVFTAGAGTHGQRGFNWNKQRPDRKNMDLHFHGATKIELDEPCKDVVCGLNSTICLTVSGKLWACGANSVLSGYLGTVSKEPFVSVPERIPIDEEVLKVWTIREGVEFTSYAALTKSGCVTWGSDVIFSKTDVSSSRITPHGQMLRIEKSQDDLPPLFSSFVKEKLDCINSLILDVEDDMKCLKLLAESEEHE